MTVGSFAIPSGIDDVTPEWLTAVLRGCDSIADTVTVTGVSAERIAEDTGFSAWLYRLRITGTQGLPPSLIVKLPAQSEARGAMDLLGGYQREVSFYQSVAGRAPLLTPRVYTALIAGPRRVAGAGGYRFGAAVRRAHPVGVRLRRRRGDHARCHA